MSFQRPCGDLHRAQHGGSWVFFIEKRLQVWACLGRAQQHIMIRRFPSKKLYFSPGNILSQSAMPVKQSTPTHWRSCVLGEGSRAHASPHQFLPHMMDCRP